MIERYTLPRMARVWQDDFKFRTMLEIELLVAEALSRQGIVPKEAAARMRKKARFDVAEIQKIEEATNHDIVAFVTNVSASLGADARYLHIGLTSSDLLDTTLGVQLVAAADILLEDVKGLRDVLAAQAKKYKNTVCMGRTHGVHAEPTTFGLKLALWYDETLRNIERLGAARERVGVGKISGAVGTYSNIDPSVEEFVCKKLGLKPAPVSTQIVQRDIYADFMSCLAVCAATLEQFATEIRHLQRTEVLEAEEPFGKGQKGSSAMPHKRNPVICERICGLSRIVRANAAVSLENVALWHERDISHSSAERVILPDSTILLDYMLHKCIGVIDGLLVYPEKMLANVALTHGLIFSQRVLLALMEKGLERPRAYDIVQRSAMITWKEHKTFKETLLADREFVKHITAKELEKLMDIQYYLRNTGKIFRRLGL